MKYHMIVTIGFYTTSHAKFHDSYDSGDFDIPYGLNRTRKQKLIPMDAVLSNPTMEIADIANSKCSLLFTV